MENFVLLIPLFLGVIFPGFLAIISSVSSEEIKAKMPIAAIVHSIACLVYCLAALGPNGSSLITDESLILSPAILGDSLAMVLSFDIEEIWWFLGLSTLSLLISMGVSRFNVLKGRDESEQYTILHMSFCFACLSLFTKGALVACVYFEFWFLTMVYASLTLADDNGEDLIRKCFSGRVFTLVFSFVLLFLAQVENLISRESLVFFAVILYIVISALFRPIVHYWLNLLLSSFGLLAASKILITSMEEISRSIDQVYFGFGLPLLFSIILSILAVLSKSLMRAITLYVVSVWLLIIGSFMMFDEFRGPTQTLIIISSLLATVMTAFMISMKETFAEAKVDWLIIVFGLVLHLLAIGVPFTVGFYSILSVVAAGLPFQAIYFGALCLASIALIRILILSKLDPVFWDVKQSLSFREATPWFISVILLLSNEYFSLGAILGQQSDGEWKGIVNLEFDGWSNLETLPQVGIMAAVMLFGFGIGYLATKKNLKGEWSKPSFFGGTYSLVPDINFSRIRKLNFALVWLPLQLIEIIRMRASNLSLTLAQVLGGSESHEFSRIVWTESLAYMRSFSMFIRFIQNGLVRYYLFYGFLTFSTFVYIYWEVIS